MSFRFFEWGKYPDQATECSARQIDGRSIIVTGSTTNNDYGGINYTSNDVEVSCVGGTDGHYKMLLMKQNLVPVRARLGQAPILINATWTVMRDKDYDSAFTGVLQLFRLLLPVGWTTATARYRDTAITWAHDVYAPLAGEDMRSVPFFEDNCIAAGGTNLAEPLFFADVTDELGYCLRAGVDWKILLRIPPGTTTSVRLNVFGEPTGRPYFLVAYLNPIEFFAANTDGTIDLENIAIDSEDISDSLYLGSLQRGDTGAPTKSFMKNLSENTFNLVEVWDDYPEWTDPTHNAGAGTGNLDYIVPLEASVSQRYTLDFYSATEYEIKAEAFRDYTASLHPQIDSDSNWRGTVLTDFVAPSGGLTIPKECWQPDGLSASDEFEVLVLGNTTDTDWPADSNDQVEITHDSGNSPVAASWRPVNSRRTRLRSTVTIDATTKTFYVKPIVASHWPIGGHCWIGDDTNLDEGTIKTVSEATIGSATLTGSGADDITVEGNFIGTDEDNLYIEIAAEGTPDTFKWGRGSSYPPSWSSAVNVTVEANRTELEDGVHAWWTGVDNHTAGDYWTIPLTPFNIEVENLTSGSNAYAVNSRVATTLPAQSVSKAIHAKTNAASGASEAQPHRIYIDDPATIGFTAGSAITISNTDATLHNTRVIVTAGVTSTYIELTADLTEDFPSGSFVIQAGEGEVPFWLRVVSTSTTSEELKQLRLNVRT